MPQAPSKFARRRARTIAQAATSAKGERASSAGRTGAQATASRGMTPGIWWTLGIMAIATFVIFAILAYALDWEWTGFPGNTLWDWLQLLLVPLALNAATIWYSGGGRLPLGERRLIRVGLVVAAIIVVVVVIAAAYRLRWAWTGFLGQPAMAASSPQPKTLWDWLNMLLLPCAVAIATIQFSRRRQQPTDKSA